jgi:hypothetical protein
MSLKNLAWYRKTKNIFEFSVKIISETLKSLLVTKIVFTIVICVIFTIANNDVYFDTRRILFFSITIDDAQESSTVTHELRWILLLGCETTLLKITLLTQDI